MNSTEHPPSNDSRSASAPTLNQTPPPDCAWYSPAALWQRKSTVIAALSLAGIISHLILRFGVHEVEGTTRMPLLAVLVIGGLPLLYDLSRKLLKREFGSDLLGGISIITSVILGEYLAGSIIVLMLAGGEALESYALRSASSVLAALAKRMPSVAHRKRDSAIVDVALVDVEVGDTLVIFPHDICPVDGVVIEGHGVMDESYLTGEPFQITKTSGSTVISVGQGLEPLDEYYLWCDHRAWREAAAITETAHKLGMEAINWSGGTYSSEWGFSKVLHWLRNNPTKRDKFVTALENCDMVIAELCGIQEPSLVPRSICAMGHKWMWNEALGGLPSEDFFVAVDPVLAGIRDKLNGRYATSNTIAGELSPEWADRLGLRAGIPIPVAGIDAHWDAIGAGCRVGDVVNVIGTSTCIMAIGERISLVPGVCGVVEGSIHPGMTGVEAGLSATGDIFDAIARRAGSTVAALSEGLENYQAGQTGLLRLTWGQRRPYRVGEPGTGRHHSWLEIDSCGAGRVVRGHRGHSLSHADHSRAHGAASGSHSTCH